MKLQIQVIPDKCIGRNLHSNGILEERCWENISRNFRNRRICGCCEKFFRPGELNAHEVWEFDPENRIQRLVSIIPVCDKCHKTIHYNFVLTTDAFQRGEDLKLKSHYVEVNQCTEKQFEADLNDALRKYRKMNQIQGQWSMDISYILESGFVAYKEINQENLEKIAPDSKRFLILHEEAAVLRFNNIPPQCLIDKAYERVKEKSAVPCEICGNKGKKHYVYYDLRVKSQVPQLVLVKIRKICPICRKTIYYGANKHFKRMRKTTRHYMKVNNCSYKQCVMDARAAKAWITINRAAKLFVYLRMPVLPEKEFHQTCKYFRENGARFDNVRRQWYLCPIKYLWNFRNYM